MKLTESQLREYEQEGFLFLPSLFSAAEVGALKAQLPGELVQGSDRSVAEKDATVVRSVYGSHQSNEVFRSLSRHPRLVEPARQMLGGDLYVYQFKINAKAAFAGDVWEWHQDYVFWLEEDGLPEPRLTNVVVFLDEVNEFNGPMILVPGSQREGVIAAKALAGVPAEYADKPEWITDLTADLKFSVGHQAMAHLARQHGMTAPKGPAGSVLFFHPNLVHGSAQNMSPFGRAITIVTYSHVANLPTKLARPEFLVSRDYQPIAPVADDSLLAHGRSEAAVG
jgi:hypothetical protein